MTAAASISLGAFPVEAGSAEVAAFRAAIGLPAADAVPLSFPMRWLVAPAVRAAMLDLVPEPDLVLVHESQSFDYNRSLRVGGSYDLALTARRETAPDRLCIDGRISDADGTFHAGLETILRLVTAPSA